MNSVQSIIKEEISDVDSQTRLKKNHNQKLQILPEKNPKEICWKVWNNNSMLTWHKKQEPNKNK